ncbi:ATPase, histidine kinase-, DNA gyrase B (macronuclear) [Tetrahymena thermophila SB210]|uniref:histidine kinase n=1 Tax=Tetrahymena thermophila (strain SB210) TaxID=312017 RepID=Q237H5_TETTS|nr:ATPase, histidine kinase-, DNA gyrase B [Tetrahymena thermophila SB210]EAR92766.2 ATPase, histidine kinase-, DNA gyrase B [Tetrahymena thermophila SB210]|eukprot:XP_001013011.2 ATPase, histidine kinase-, DNA gyrase B [Tetrahymena thermophila SB210]
MKNFSKIIQILKPERLYSSIWYFRFKDSEIEEKYNQNKFESRKNVYFMIQIILLIIIGGLFLYNLIFTNYKMWIARGVQVIIIILTILAIYKQKEKIMKILSIVQFLVDCVTFNVVLKQLIIDMIPKNPDDYFNYALFIGVRYTFQLLGYMISVNNTILQILMLATIYIMYSLQIDLQFEGTTFLTVAGVVWILFSFFMLIQLEVLNRNHYFQSIINEKKHQSWKQILDEKILNSIFVVTYGNITNTSTGPQVTPQNSNTILQRKPQNGRASDNVNFQQDKNNQMKQTIIDKRLKSYKVDNKKFNKTFLHFQKEKRESLSHITFQQKLNTIENDSMPQSSQKQNKILAEASDLQGEKVLLEQQANLGEDNTQNSAESKQYLHKQQVNKANSSDKINQPNCQEFQKDSRNRDFSSQKIEEQQIINSNNQNQGNVIECTEQIQVESGQACNSEQTGKENQNQFKNILSKAGINGVFSAFSNLNNQSNQQELNPQSKQQNHNLNIFSSVPANDQEKLQQETPYLEASNKLDPTIKTLEQKIPQLKPNDSRRDQFNFEPIEQDKSLDGNNQFKNHLQNKNSILHNINKQLHSKKQKQILQSQQNRTPSSSSEQSGLIFPFFNNYFVKTFKDYDERDYQRKVIERIEVIHDGKKMTLYDKIKEIMRMRHKQMQPTNDLIGGNINIDNLDDSSEQPYGQANYDHLDKFVFPGCFFQDQNMYFDIQISKCTWGQQEQSDSLIVILNDISQRVTNQRLKQLDKYKDDLLANVSHDFKTPLNGMVAQLQLIQSLLKNVFAQPKRQHDGLFQNNIQNSVNLEKYSKLDENNVINFKNCKSDVDATEAGGSSEQKNLGEKNVNENKLEVPKEEQIQVSDINNSTDVDDLKSQIFNYLYQVEQNVWMLNHLVNDIQDYSQMNNQTLRINISPFRLYDVVNDVQNLIKIQSDAKSIAFEVKSTIPMEKVQLNSDKIRLKQILINLLSNALKFTYEGFVKLEIDYIVNEETQQNSLQFSVIDTGIGMPPEVQANLFKMYSSFDTNKINKHGVGLGLFISKCLVTLLGPMNEIQVESTKGKGSTFKFQIYQNLDLSKKRRGTSYAHNQSFARTNKSENIAGIYQSNLNTPQALYLQNDHQLNTYNGNSPNLNSFSLKKVVTNSMNNNSNGNYNLNQNNINNIFNQNNNNTNPNNTIYNNYSQFREVQPNKSSSSQVNTPSSLKQNNLRKLILSNNNINAASQPHLYQTNKNTNGQNQLTSNNIEISKFAITPETKLSIKMFSKNDLQASPLQKQSSHHSQTQQILQNNLENMFEEGYANIIDKRHDRQANSQEKTTPGEVIEGGVNSKSQFFIKGNSNYQTKYIGIKSTDKVKKWGFVQIKYKSDTQIQNKNDSGQYQHYRLIDQHNSQSNQFHSNTFLVSKKSVNFQQPNYKKNMPNQNNDEVQYLLLQTVQNTLDQNKQKQIFQKEEIKSFSSQKIPLDSNNKQPYKQRIQNSQNTETTFTLDQNNLSERFLKEKDVQQKKFQRENLPTLNCETEQNRSNLSICRGQFQNKAREFSVNSNLLFTNHLSNETLSSDNEFQEGTLAEYNKQKINFEYINSQMKPKTLVQLVNIAQMPSVSEPFQFQDDCAEQIIQFKPSSHILKEKNSVVSNEDIPSTETIDIKSVSEQKEFQMVTPIKNKAVALLSQNQNDSVIQNYDFIDQQNLQIQNQYTIYQQNSEINHPIQHQIDDNHVIYDNIESITQSTIQQNIKTKSREFKDLTMKVLPNRKLRLLYAEDEMFSVVMLKNFLKEYEKFIELTVAFNGELALQKIKQSNHDSKPFDAVFMDSNMPVMDGPETIQEIRNLIQKSEINPLIIITCTSYTDKQKYIELGSDSFLSKPTNLQSILEALIFIIRQLENNLNKCK